MKTASGPLITLLNTSSQFVMVDLFEFETASGFSRYSGSDVDIVYNGNTYTSTGPLMKRSGSRTKVGLESDSMRMTVFASTSHLLEGLPFVSAAAGGALDGARVTVYRAFLSDWSTAPSNVGVIVMFSGRVSDVMASRNKVEITVNSDIEILSMNLPRNLYQPPCVNTLYDAGCGVLRSAFLVNGTATGGTTNYLTSALAQAANWFNQGTVLFTSGQNAGIKRTTKLFASGRFDFALPLPYAPLAGDTFTALPGCDGTQSTCSGKFSNTAHNTMFPFIPAAEVAL